MGDDQTIGEIGRSVERIERAVESLSAKMELGLAPVTELKVHVQRAQEDINGLGTRVTECTNRIGAIELRAAGIAGGVTTLVILIKFLLGK